MVTFPVKKSPVSPFLVPRKVETCSTASSKHSFIIYDRDGMNLWEARARVPIGRLYPLFRNVELRGVEAVEQVKTSYTDLEGIRREQVLRRCRQNQACEDLLLTGLQDATEREEREGEKKEIYNGLECFNILQQFVKRNLNYTNKRKKHTQNWIQKLYSEIFELRKPVPLFLPIFDHDESITDMTEVSISANVAYGCFNFCFSFIIVQQFLCSALCHIMHVKQTPNNVLVWQIRLKVKHLFIKEKSGGGKGGESERYIERGR